MNPRFNIPGVTYADADPSRDVATDEALREVYRERSRICMRRARLLAAGKDASHLPARKRSCYHPKRFRKQGPVVNGNPTEVCTHCSAFRFGGPMKTDWTKPTNPTKPNDIPQN